MPPPVETPHDLGDLGREATWADRELARREPRLPGLAVVLDADSLLECLDALLPAAIARPTAARVDYVRYKPHTSIVAGVALDTPAGPLPAFAKAVGPASPKVGNARRRSVETDAGWGVVADPSLGLVIGTAASDRRLPGATRLGRGPNPDVLRYKPERRLVTRGTHRGRPAVLKAHQPQAARAAAGAHRALAAEGAPVAELLATDLAAGVVACAWVPGTPLSALPADADAARRAGAALAFLHRAPARGLSLAPPLRPELTAAATAIGALLPALKARATTLADRLARRLDGHTGPAVAIHGDWSPDQAIRTATDLVLIDLDRARRDDPATDIAAWIAAEHATGRAPADRAPEQVAAPLLDGHAAAGGPALRDNLYASTAAALLRRAVEPFRTRHPDWPTEVERLLRTAERHAATARC